MTKCHCSYTFFFICKQISDNNGVKITNREIYEKTIQVAKNLTKLGYAKPNVIGIYSGNNHYLAPIIFGCIVNGMPLSTIDPSFKKGLKF